MILRNRLLSQLTLVLFLAGGAFTASATQVRWTVASSDFVGGGSLSGTFLYDGAAGQMRTWSLSVSGGDTINFPPFIFDTQSSSFSGDNGTFTFRALRPSPNGIRTLVLGPLGLCNPSGCVSMSTWQLTSGLVTTLPPSDSVGQNRDGYVSGSSCRCRALNARFQLAGVPDLSVAVSHSGNLKPGQNGAVYTIHVSNAGPGSTFESVTVTDSLPGGLTATNIEGSGWNCTLATLTCTRSDGLDPQSTYPPITLVVNVALNVPGSLTNTATVSGGGQTNSANSIDPTLIDPAITTASMLPAGTVGLQYTQSFVAGSGAPPYSFSTSGPLPPDLLLDSSGVLTGIPKKAGIYNVIVTVTDANGSSASGEFWLTLK